MIQTHVQIQTLTLTITTTKFLPLSLSKMDPNSLSSNTNDHTTVPSTPMGGGSKNKWVLLMSVNYTFMIVGSVSSSLLSRFYFVHGGNSRWVSTAVQSIGFPLLLPPIYLFTSPHSPPPFTLFTPRLLSLCLLIGILLGVNNFLFSWGISYLPVSTASLLLSSQLGFNLVLSVAMVRQKVRLTNLNCVVLLTLSSVLLAVGSKHDKPEGVTGAKFFLGFFSTLGAALLFAVYLPIMEIVLRHVRDYRMVMEMQFLMEAAATVFALTGMASTGGFEDFREEAKSRFDLGTSAYVGTIVATVVCWQMCFMSTAGSVFLTSSLNSGIVMTTLLAVNVVAGVVVFGDNFGGTKVVSTVMCLWAFSTYLYGEYDRSRKRKADEAAEGTEMGLRGGGGVV